MRGINGLYIVGSQFKHEGWYECRATSVFDSIGGKAYLTVKGQSNLGRFCLILCPFL